jgi:uncharacterized protein YqeY
LSAAEGHGGTEQLRADLTEAMKNQDKLRNHG